MKHTSINYKDDIKVLGRVVSIATDNKVAEAEQLFDTTFKYSELGNYNIDVSKRGLDQYDINRLFGKKIKAIEDAGLVPDSDGYLNNIKIDGLTVKGGANVDNLNVTNNANVGGKLTADEIVTNKLTVNDRADIKDLHVNNSLFINEKTIQQIIDEKLNTPDLVIIAGPTQVEIGSTIALHAEVLPTTIQNRNVKWSSSNSSVASVNQNTGIVTGVSASSEPVWIKAESTEKPSVYGMHLVTVHDGTTPTPQPVSWALNASPDSVSANVNEEFTITVTDATTNGGIENIMIPSVPSGLTLVNTQANGTNPFSKKFTFKGTAAGTYTIAVVGMADDIEVIRELISIVVSIPEEPQITKHNLIFYDTGLPTEEDPHANNDYTIVENEQLLNQWYPNNFEVGRAEFTAGNPTSNPTLDSLIAQIDENTVRQICAQHGVDRSGYGRLFWDLGGYYYNWPDHDVYIKAVWRDDGPVCDVTFVYDPSTSNDAKIMSVDGSSKEAFTFENNGGYNHALMYGSGYGRMDDTAVPANGSRTYTIAIDNGYKITGIDPNFQYNTNATSEEEQRLYDHITYNIANDGKSMTLTVTDIVERDPLNDSEPDHHGPSAREYDLIDDCNGYLDIVILYEAA